MHTEGKVDNLLTTVREHIALEMSRDETLAQISALLSHLFAAP